MRQTTPHRTRNQSAERYVGQHKKSGAQHLLPEDDQEQAAHQPHRLNRDDMQKILDTDEDQSET